MTRHFGLLVGLSFLLVACALPPPRAATPERAPTERPNPTPAERPVPRVVPVESAASALLGELARVGALSAEQRRRELAELEGNRLDDTRRFQLAALLEREESVEALERSFKQLVAMGDTDARSQSLIDLMKKSLRVRIEQKTLSSRNAELQDKLEQIKALEKSLLQRSGPQKTP